MKFRIGPEEKKEQPVEITLLQMSDGDVGVMANGIAILWIMERGDIMLSSVNRLPLEQMGFQMEGSRIKIRYPQ